MNIKKKVLVIAIIFISILASLFFLYQKGLEKEQQLETLQIIPDEKEDTDVIDETNEQNNDPADEPEETENLRQIIVDRIETVIGYFTNNVTIVAIGDSLTEGVGDETDNEGYVGILNDTINAESPIAQFSNHGKRGNRSDQLLARLTEDEIEQDIENADIVLITIGANDVMQVFKENLTNLALEPFATEKKLYEKRLTQILTTIHTLNEDAKIYLIGFYNPFKHVFADIEELEFIVNDWNEAGMQVANKTAQSHFIPITDLFTHVDTDFFSDDNFHPNQLGYQLMADRILEYITKEDDKQND